MSDGTIVLEARGISRAFPGVQALEGVDLTLRAGEVHALMGQNGAGKSTLIKVLTGLCAPDAGSIKLLGQPVALHSPPQAQRLGISAVHQESHLLPNLTVAENICAGRYPRRKWLGGKRQVIERLIRDPGVREYLTREIQVRQGTLEQNRGAIQVRGSVPFQRASHVGEFLFSVPTDDPAASLALSCGRRGREDGKRGGRSKPFLFDSREDVVQALVIAHREHVLRGDYVKAFEPRQPRQQIVVSEPEPQAIGGLIHHRHDDALIRGRRV